MKKRLIVIFLDFVLLVMFFLPIFHVKEGDTQTLITGFQGLLHPQLLVFGNITLGLFILALGVQLILHLIGFFKTSFKSDEKTIVTTNIQLMAGMVIVTFLGTYLEWIGFVWVGVIVLQTYINYKMK